MKNETPDNIEQAILHFVQGNANDTELQVVQNWLDKNPDKRAEVYKDKDIWDACELNAEQLNILENQQWNRLETKLQHSEGKTRKLYNVLKYAAILIMALGVGWMSRYIYSEHQLNRSVEMRTVEAIKGQIKEIFLADGTHVWLNADSKLSFPSNFTDRTRRVELQGEAYFEVKSNEKNPFLVKTGKHIVKVTGTKFNICEYPEDKIIETTLVEGKVKIMTGNVWHDLHPGEQSTFYTESAEVLIGEKDFDIYTAWREGRYEFRNESVGKVFEIMERWWDVEIEYSKKDFKYEYISGVLRKHKPIEQHFEVIDKLVPIDYQVNGDEIKVKLN